MKLKYFLFAVMLLIWDRPAFASTNALNAITLKNESGSAIVNYPFQFGRPFVAGAIANAPQVLVNGRPVVTQADIKNRYADRSVKFAVIAVLIPSLPASGPVTVTFRNQTERNNTPLTRAQMLDPRYAFGATMTLTSPSGVTATVDARAMLMNGDYKLWTSGPVAQTIELADDSAARRYDIGFGDGYRPFRPRFYATFWPTTHQVFVRFVGENGLTTELEDLRYQLSLRIGATRPKQVYAIDLSGTNQATKPAKVHWTLSSWTKTFWLGGTPSPEVNIDNRLVYLAWTRFVPNFDPTIDVSAGVSHFFGLWNRTSKKDWYDAAWDG